MATEKVTILEADGVTTKEVAVDFDGDGDAYPWMKLAFGADDTFTKVQTGTGLPVNVENASLTIGNITGSISLPTDASTSALQTTGNTSLATIAGAVSGSEMQCDILTLPALATGSNAIGKLAANDGVDIGDVTINNAAGSGVYIRPGTGINLNTSSIAGTVTAENITGNVASGASDSGNPVKVAGVYNSSAPTFTNGQRGDIQLDASGNLKVNIASGSSLGTEYTEGDTDSTITGSAILGEAPSNTLEPLQLDASSNLKVSVENSTLAVTQSGTWNVNNISGAVSLPTGAATESTLSDIDTKLGTIDNVVNVEDTAHSTGDSGIMPLGVRSDAGGAFGADGDYVPFSFDSNNALRVTGGGGGTEYTEDVAAATNPVGNMLMAVRLDTLTGQVSADGDNIALRATNNGELYVKQTDAIPVTDNGGSLTVDGTVEATQSGTWNVNNISGTVSLPTGAATESTLDAIKTAVELLDNTVSGSELQVDIVSSALPSGASTESTLSTISTNLAAFDNIVQTEDAAHSSGDTGVMSLAVRNDGGGSLVGADNDYSPLQVDSNGALRVTGGGGGTEYTEDDAAASNPVGNMLMAVRLDSLAAITSADGDNIALRATNNGELYVKQTDAVPITDNGGSLTVDGTIAATQSGTWDVTNISGTVSLPTGAATESTLDAIKTAVEVIDNAISGNEMQVDLVGSIPAGTNNIGDVDVLTLPALAAGTNAIGKLTANSGVIIGAVEPQASSAGGCTPHSAVSAASTNATSLKTSAGTVYMVSVTNTNASARYLKLYNKASAPTVGTDTPIQRYTIPGNSNGAGNNPPIPICGLEFTTGIAYALTTGAADSDTGAVAANEILVNIGYE